MQSSDNNAVKTVAIVGAGVIGISWPANFIAAGLRVNLYDIQENFQESAQPLLEQMLNQITAANLANDTLLANVNYFSDLKKAVNNVDVVQENGPEKVDFKQAIFAEIESYVKEETLLISSSSGIIPEKIGPKMKDPSRVVIGHPFNPPHIVPLVEICAGPKTPEALIKRVMAFYQDCGKCPVVLKKAIPGFVANRLQTVLLREAINIVEQGVVNIKELDDIVLNSLGIRWASVGPFLAGHLGGGEQGLHGILQHILSTLLTAMELPAIDDRTLDLLDEQIDEFYPNSKTAQFASVRDERQKAIIEIQKNKPLNS